MRITTILILAILSFFDLQSQATMDVIDEVNLDSLTSLLRIISGEDSTFVNDQKVLIQHRASGMGNDLAADYIKEKLRQNHIDVLDEPFDGSGRNIIGIKTGLTNPHDIYLICAHYDSVTRYCADDNGSGTTAILEIAICRHMADEYPQPFHLICTSDTNSAEE